jgi:hypothetical protein
VVSNFREHPTHLEGTLEFLDFNAVPDARMAYEAMKKGAIKGISFGFARQAEEDDTENRGATRITQADMFEASPVLRASVPGSRVLAVRADDRVPRTIAADILVKFSTGQIDLAEALTELKTIDPEAVIPAFIEALDSEHVEEIIVPEQEAPVTEVVINPDDEEVFAKLASLVRRK